MVALNLNLSMIKQGDRFSRSIAVIVDDIDDKCVCIIIVIEGALIGLLYCQEVCGRGLEAMKNKYVFYNRR